MTKRKQLGKPTITVREDNALVIKFDSPDGHQAFLAALELVEAGERQQRAVRSGGSVTGQKRMNTRRSRDESIRKRVAKYTGEPRDMVAFIARAEGVEPPTVRRTLKRLAAKKRSVA